MTEKLNEAKLAAACRHAYAAFAGVPVLDLFAFALGFELLKEKAEAQNGAAFIQRCAVILGWGLEVDDALLATIARRSTTPAYLPTGHAQDRYVVTRNGKDVLALGSALTAGEIIAIEQGRNEIAQLGLWNDQKLEPILEIPERSRP